MAEIKLITFDLDNTLWNVEVVIRNAEGRMRTWLHERVPDYGTRIPAEAVLDLRNAVLQEQPALRHDLSRLREEILFRAISHCGYREAEARRLANDAFKIFLDARHEVEFFEGALETLEYLSRHYVLGALTNGNADFARLKLDRYFQFGYSAASVGVGKPAPQIFHAALQHAGRRAAEAVHVGDHLQDDIEGASGVGMHTIWVNLERHDLPDGTASPSHVVHLLEDVPAGILAIQDRSPPTP
jgi:FMN hydrolase / 5-amino-6-(5-phospho-D-ribitylamino)uracil phosphatase